MIVAPAIVGLAISILLGALGMPRWLVTLLSFPAILFYLAAIFGFKDFFGEGLPWITLLALWLTPIGAVIFFIGAGFGKEIEESRRPKKRIAK